jgi:hypothetical protein
MVQLENATGFWVPGWITGLWITAIGAPQTSQRHPGGFSTDHHVTSTNLEKVVDFGKDDLLLGVSLRDIDFSNLAAL